LAPVKTRADACHVFDCRTFLSPGVNAAMPGLTRIVLPQAADCCGNDQMHFHPVDLGAYRERSFDLAASACLE
jgi:hypothetical protein